MRYRTFLAMSAAAALSVSMMVASTGPSAAADNPKTAAAAQPAPNGSFAYSGQDAAAIMLPKDVKQLSTTTFADGRTSTRYQQVVDNATVFGGQITVIQGASGQADAVIGAYFPGLVPKNSATLSKGQAKSIATAQIGAGGDFSNELRIDPRTGRLFYEVESIRAAERPVRWVDAASGNVTKAFDKIAHGEGIGVKGDTKQINTTLNATSGLYELFSGDQRQKTYDAQNRTNTPIVMTDANDIWDLNKSTTSPAQAAGVDAHYYANVVDDFYQSTFGRNSIDDAGMRIVSVVHYGSRYCNAFWNGAYMTYGDGDGKTCLPLSGGLDVVGHELTHGVTERTSNLIYENEPGALNEAFSDMMGNTIEFYAQDNGLDPAAKPDWLIGEDIMLDGTANPGFRNMGDPAEDGDPSHYSLRYTGTADGGGVHTNSGIANHAYYLSVNGGRNAGCSPTTYRAATLTADCGVVVPALGLATTAQIFYAGFTSLPEYANFCDARNATLATAGGKNTKAIAATWDAVGVHSGCTQGTPPPPPCVSNANAKLPIESPHPYGNNGDCTWTYTHTSANFKFHFSLLDTEAGYDYVYVKDASGAVLATYDGLYRRGATSPCITTTSGSIQLVSDAGVTAQGFTVDAIEPC
ncbi:MAG: peptidase M4 [Phycicoccus sp.]|nr:peptidase M4 [Phycicoccus sp.]